MDIEKLATAAVDACVSKTDILSPYINDKDREPSWDGSIYIFKTKEKNKENLKRVPVQVKGTICDDHSLDKIKFDVSVDDLNNYLNNGGCVYFVVYLDANGENPKIYYTSLLPFKIKQILKETNEEQKTKRIELEAFPTENDKKVAALLAFHVDMEKQASFIHVPTLSVEEYEKQGLLEECGFTVTGYGSNRDFRDWIFQNDLYLYAKIKGSPVLHPVEMMSRNLHVEQNVDAIISIAGKQYYNLFRRILTSIVDLTAISKVDFAGTKILLEFDKVDEPDVFRVFDFFNGMAAFWFSDPNKQDIPPVFTSRYSAVLHASEFEEVGNIDYEKILKDFENYNDNINYSAQNQTLLEMIKTYDRSQDNRKDILEYAERLSASLLKRQKDENGNDLPLHVLNALQIAKRKRGLTKDEQKEVFAIAEAPNQSPEMRTGAYLLLDNQLAAEVQFARIQPAIQEEFKSYPICRFWKQG